ncbi:hypothetical protein DFR86_10075 [Acidianus sulfidivorans JP7]|uniref:Uncharacterized protein n=1 Tax=Acidianus sulfidivorans JP7 TaxID=619593 RepID=A0A2U9IPB7_9CREN|nr:hypothetical protein [Acidianus sulfidivorans]AWR97851.1 hypothetical protein DFR86_10075 [Acidianus sulfidivorans JP7]
MNRVEQLLREAIDEAEKYGSLLSMYFLIKKIALDYSSIYKKEEEPYDITVDDIILISLSHGEVTKIPFFAISFLIYDYFSSSNKYHVQDCIFYFRWDKRIFVYSPRIEAHLYYLIRTGYVSGIKFYKLTEKGKFEMDLKLKSFSEKERKDILFIINNVLSMKKTSDIKKYVRRQFFGR